MTQQNADATKTNAIKNGRYTQAAVGASEFSALLSMVVRTHTQTTGFHDIPKAQLEWPRSGRSYECCREGALNERHFQLLTATHLERAQARQCRRHGEAVARSEGRVLPLLVVGATCDNTSTGSIRNEPTSCWRRCQRCRRHSALAPPLTRGAADIATQYGKQRYLSLRSELLRFRESS